MSKPATLIPRLLAEVLADSHRYAPGIEQRRPTLLRDRSPRGVLRLAREGLRDVAERAAAQAGFSHRHFDPEVGARNLARILELADGLEATYASLGDGHSRRVMLDVLKLRVLGPYHSSLRITPHEYRRRQAQADRRLRVARATFAVSDPYFSPLSLYRVPLDGGDEVTLHCHSVDVVNVFLLGQYGYRRDGREVSAARGEVALDVGGCWGDTALYFAHRVGSEGRVITFEFDPENLELMRTNLALNQRLSERIELAAHALWSRSGETLEVAQAGRMTTVFQDAEVGAGTLRIPTLTLDDFAARRALERVDFVKMDVEGAELEVIEGARETLRRFAPKLAIAAYHRDDDLVRIPAALSAVNPGYRFYLDSFAPVEDETILFALAPKATSESNAT